MRGQMLLIVVLVMVVVLTVGLSAATRTITNIRISSDEEASERAFSAAEAGLEQVIGGNQQIATGTFDNASTYRTSIVQQAGREILLNNNIPIQKDDSADMWLSTYPNYTSPFTGDITIHWGSAGDTCTPIEASNTMAALDIAVISGTVLNPRITHYPVDPCPQRRTTNNFGAVSLGSGTVKDKTFPYRVTISVNSGLLARIKPLYAPTSIGVNGCSSGGANCIDLPSQGTLIESIGTAENATRKIMTYRSYPKIPSELFQFVLFAPN